MSLNYSPNLLIRTDANSKIGSGHFMRCLALAQAWLSVHRFHGGTVTFALQDAPEHIRKRIRDEKMELADVSSTIESTLECAGKINATWIVVDGYHFGADFQKAVRAAGKKLLFIDDDAHAQEYLADLVLNHNISAESVRYPKAATGTTMLLGTKYALIRSEFQRFPEKRSDGSFHLLITLGGSDAADITALSIQAALQSNIQNLKIKVVIPNQALVSNLPADKRIEYVVNPDNMAELMHWGDLAITGGGVTCSEMAHVGLPNIILILADNQKGVASGFDSAQVSVNLGPVKNVTKELLVQHINRLGSDSNLLKRMSENGRKLVDGSGAGKVVQKMTGQPVRLQPARAEDAKMLWEWVNEPSTRSASFNREFISWERHVQWFESKLASANCRLFIAYDLQDQPIGQLRYEFDTESTATVSISIATGQRGKNHSSALLKTGTNHLFGSTTVTKINAYIKTDNEKSVRAFEAAGYKRTGTSQINGSEAYHYIRERKE